MNRLIVVFIVAAALSGPLAAAEEVIVGVLEHPQCKKEPISAVRALFHKRSREWVALNSEEASSGVPLADISWTVALNGRRLGLIKTIDPGYSSPNAWTYPRDRLLLLAPDQSVPVIANDQELFGGWCEVPPNRPLVLISRPNFKDPQGWKQFRADSTLRNRLFSQFAAAAGEVNTCESRNSDNPSIWAYSADDLLFSASYQDHAGRKLVALQLNPARNQCDGPPDDAWSMHWFIIGESIQSLGLNLSLIDAGDYDADSTSEVLFWYSGYNNDGYSLFYDGLQKRVDYLWNYH